MVSARAVSPSVMLSIFATLSTFSRVIGFPLERR